MVKWKLQAVEPDTCDPPGCRYMEWWDAEADPDDRVHTVAAFDRVCPAHTDLVPIAEMLGFDGNWKPKREYIEYQRAWFRRLNHVEWLERNGDEPMPPQIADFTEDPTTTGSLPAPPKTMQDGMARAYALNREHNQRKNHMVSVAWSLRPDLDRFDVSARVTWSWSGTGEERVLLVNLGRDLVSQRDTAQGIADIHFGAGRVIVQ